MVLAAAPAGAGANVARLAKTTVTKIAKRELRATAILRHSLRALNKHPYPPVRGFATLRPLAGPILAPSKHRVAVLARVCLPAAYEVRSRSRDNGPTVSARRSGRRRSAGSRR